MPCVRDKGRLLYCFILAFWHTYSCRFRPSYISYGRQCGQSRFLDVGCLMTQTREHLNSVLSESVLLNTARSARERVRTPGDIQEVIYEQRERVFHWDIQTRENNV